MKLITIILLLVSFLISDYQTENQKLKLISSEEIEKILVEFTDSMKVKEVLGNDYIMEEGSRYLNTIIGCSTTRWYTLDYINQGIKVMTFTRFGDSKIKRSQITLNFKSNWEVLGITCGSSTFENVMKETGKWFEFSDNEGGYNSYQVGYITDFIQYRTKPMTDTESLDCENKNQMETLFKSTMINTIILKDNKHLMKW